MGIRAGYDRRPLEETCMANGREKVKAGASLKAERCGSGTPEEVDDLKRSEREELRSGNTFRQCDLKAKQAAKKIEVAQANFLLLSFCPPPSTPT